MSEEKTNENVLKIKVGTLQAKINKLEKELETLTRKVSLIERSLKKWTLCKF